MTLYILVYLISLLDKLQVLSGMVLVASGVCLVLILMNIVIEEHVSKFKLFCMYEGVKHKVIRASSMGDVFITENLKADSYSKRVPITQLYGFSKD